ncbi:MAG: hypothetical protein D6795_08295 [Deltaproteobacteria bacterium]|nr:MAG: hypothetical protein D6795_08295 [Deltaproteobacteria bacterium]
MRRSVRQAALMLAFVIVGSLPSWATAETGVPIVDDTFDVTSTVQDIDLFVTREKFYESVDLGAFGLGTQDYVQSILFGSGGLSESGNRNGSFAVKVTFENVGPGFKILAALNDPARADDLFAVPQSDDLGPLDVGEPVTKATETGASAGSALGTNDGISKLSFSEFSFHAWFNDSSFSSDFSWDAVRLLIDYGDSFTPGVVMKIEMTEGVMFPDTPTSVGIVLGASQGEENDSSLCPGDLGEVATASIPLTIVDDSDGIDACRDNCPEDPNENQSDQDLDGLGDVCDCAPNDTNEPGEDGECPGCGITPAIPGVRSSRSVTPGWGLLLLIGLIAFRKGRRVS